MNELNPEYPNIEKRVLASQDLFENETYVTFDELILLALDSASTLNVRGERVAIQISEFGARVYGYSFDKVEQQIHLQIDMIGIKSTSNYSGSFIFQIGANSEVICEVRFI